MKRIMIAAVATFIFTTPAFAQDSIGYIPGMPVPQATAAPAAPSDATQPAAADTSTAKISKVSKAGDSASAPAAAAAPSEPVTLNQDKKGYKGVTPPTRLVPENLSTFTKTSGNQLSWIGFMPEDSSHRIFIQTSQPTNYERLASSQDRVEILLSNTKLAVSNNNRELDMTYFQTPFSKAKATQNGTGVKVVVQLKEAVPCEVKQHDNMIDIIVNK